jgi:hypothetical protein
VEHFKSTSEGPISTMKYKALIKSIEKILQYGMKRIYINV